MPLEVVVRVPRVAGLTDVADDRAGLHVAELAEAREVPIAHVPLPPDHGDVLAGEPVVGVRLREAVERSADRPTGRRDDVVAPVRVVAADVALLTEVILVVD